MNNNTRKGRSGSRLSDDFKDAFDAWAKRRGLPETRKWTKKQIARKEAK